MFKKKIIKRYSSALKNNKIQYLDYEDKFCKCSIYYNL